jgi:hypothetical protein
MLENVRFHLEEEGSVKDKEGKKVQSDRPDFAWRGPSLTRLF